MGKQKLTHERAELVKYLLEDKGVKQRIIADLVGVQRPAITKIKLGHRWGEVEKPDNNRGEYLFYKLLNGKMR